VGEDTPIHLSEAVFNFLRNPRLLDAVETLIGPEIYSNPIQPESEGGIGAYGPTSGTKRAPAWRKWRRRLPSIAGKTIPPRSASKRQGGTRA